MRRTLTISVLLLLFVGGCASMPDGYGEYTWDSGDNYVGEWRNGKHHGQGTYTWASGTKYVGEWQDGNQQGQGTYTYTNGDKYVGEWRDERMNGQGTFTWANGNKHVGEWQDGKRHGQGTYTPAKGEKYVGEWRDNKFIKEDDLTEPNSTDGQVTLIYKDGKYVGGSKDGKPHGQGTVFYSDGTKHVGVFRNSEKHGLGTQYSTNGYTIQGEWIDGSLEGEALCKEKDKPIFACSYVNNEPVPTSKKANPDSFLYGVFKAALSGAVQGAIEGAINGECEMSTTSKTRQVIPGSPQYGQKTTTRTSSKNCD